MYSLFKLRIIFLLHCAGGEPGAAFGFERVLTGYRCTIVDGISVVKP